MFFKKNNILLYLETIRLGCKALYKLADPSAFCLKLLKNLLFFLGKFNNLKIFNINCSDLVYNNDILF